MAEDHKLTIQIVKATNLPNVEKKREASDPYIKITFKSKSVKSEVIDNNSNPEWNETHEMDLGAALLPGDMLDVVIKDHEKIGKDRTLAQGKVSLKDCLGNPNVTVQQALTDANNKKLDNCTLSLSLQYSGAKKGGGGSKPSGGAAAASGEGDAAEGSGEVSPEDAAMGDFEDPVEIVDSTSGNAGAMPDESAKPARKKESQRGKLPKKEMDYQVRVKVWEARQLQGGGVKPVVKVRVATQMKPTKVKKSDSPFWGEVFFFNFKRIPIELFDEVIQFDVCSSQRLRSDSMIGSFKLDVGTVWDEDRHSVQSKWLLLTDPTSDSGEPKGYLKVSIFVLGAGDEAPPDHPADDDDDVESNMLRPAGSQLRPGLFWIRLYHGVDIPQMDTGAFTAIKSFFTGGDKEEEMKKQVDPFIIAKFSGKRVKSSVQFHTNEPSFNEQLQIKFSFPSMCQKIKFDLRDWDQIGGDDPIAMGELDIGTISVDGETGFLPTFGPCWLNFYGAPREEGKESFGGDNEKLNIGKGEGCAYRGRILMEMGTIMDKKPEAAVVPIEEDQLLTIGRWCKTRKWRLFSLFEEANMLTDEVDEAVHFEVSVGNFGNSLDPDSSPMPSTTPPCQTVFDGQNYHYIPLGDDKPVISVDADYEDISTRLGIINMLEKLHDIAHYNLNKLKSVHEFSQSKQAEDLEDMFKTVATEAIEALDRVKIEIPKAIEAIEPLCQQGNTLDRRLNKYRIDRLTLMLAKAQESYENATEVLAVIEQGEEIVSELKQLAYDPQISIPDAIIWLMEDTKRVAYLRVPVKDIFYNKNPVFSGKFCTISRNVQLKYPGKKQKKEFKIPAQVRLKMWFGLQADENVWGRKGEASLMTVAETVEFEKYLIVWKDESPKFSSMDGSVALPKDGFAPPVGWAFDGDWYIAHDKSIDIDPDEGLDYFLEEVFESHGRYPGLAWQETPDKIKWVTLQNADTTARDEIVPPKGWSWENEQDAWAVDLDRAVDEKGWEYCVDIDLGGWQATEKPFHVWRRRRWVRARVKNPDDESDSAKLKPASQREDEGWEYGKTYSSKFHKVERKMDIKRRRRWQRILNRVDHNVPPLFFFDVPQKKNKIAQIAPRTFAHFKAPHKYELRAYIYQARDLISADGEGFSDPYCRVVVGNRSQKTLTRNLTVNPTWNQTLIFKNIFFYDDPNLLVEEPPPIAIEIFDWDSVGSDEYLGRVVTTPMVKLKPTDPSADKVELDWLAVKQFEDHGGELLCAFELLLADDGDLPFEPPRHPENNKLFIVPQTIAPELQRTAVEILCWGVRDLKKYQFLSIDKPEMEFEVGDFRKKSTTVIDIKNCPNFKNPVLFYELMLPVKEKYCPPMNIKVRDNRKFGRKPVVANHRVSSMATFEMEPLPDIDTEAPEILEADPIVPPLQMGVKRPVKSAVSEVSLLHTSTVIDESQLPGASGAVGPDGQPLAINETDSKDVHIAVEDTADEDGDHNASSTNLLSGLTGFGGDITGMLTGGSSKEPIPQPKPIKDDTIDWWTKYYASSSDPKTKEKAQEYIDKGGDSLQMLDCELEEVPGLDGLADFLKTFTLDQGKKGADDDDIDYMGQFKGAVVVYPLPADKSEKSPKRFFSQVPSGDVKEVLVRVYIIKATGLQPMDGNGKADPFVAIECGKTEIKDDENYVPNTLEPTFGRMYEVNATLPVEKDLKIALWDWDAIGANDLIGETIIDLEDRYLSKHRALCGLPLSYKITGYNSWRDCQKPREILEWYCKHNHLAEPVFNGNTELIVDKQRYRLDMFEAEEPEPVEEYGPADERLALHVLNQFDLVKEHIERRSLYSPTQPNLDQGQLYMWVDMFPKEIGPPGEPVDISPRLNKKYYLRVCVYNCFDTLLDETSAVTGEQMSDVYVKGWLEGMEHLSQKTDVHYRCMDGTAMFNWRFLFEFDYNPAERMISVKKKEHFWSLDHEEKFYPPRFNIQIWDNDLISKDDFLGSVQFNLEGMPQPSKSKRKCTLDILEFDPPEKDGGNRPASLFLYRRFKGMWPMKRDVGDETGTTVAGKLEMEIELVEEDEFTEKPSGKARDEPNTNPVLEPPKRPATSFLWFTSPWATFKHIIWKKYKWWFIMTLFTIIFVAFLALFIYDFPNAFMIGLFS